eukprot:12881784-Ditylum_brightwellii.AAC.1
MWKKIKFANEGSQGKNITSIQIPASWPDTDMDISPQMQLEDPKFAMTWRLFELPKEILYYLTICNRHHFGQAMGTPFTVPPLSQHFDWATHSMMSKLVLQEKYTNNELDDITQLFPSHCKLETEDSNICAKIKCDTWIGKNCAWRQTTTTSPLGKYLGQSKALVQQHSLNLNSEER